MNPAAPVTTKYISRFSRSAQPQRVAELFGLHDGGAELEDLDAGGDVRDLHRLPERHPRREHHPPRRVDRVSGPAHADPFVPGPPPRAPAPGPVERPPIRP